MMLNHMPGGTDAPPTVLGWWAHGYTDPALDLLCRATRSDAKPGARNAWRVLVGRRRINGVLRVSSRQPDSNLHYAAVRRQFSVPFRPHAAGVRLPVAALTGLAGRSNPF